MKLALSALEAAFVCSGSSLASPGLPYKQQAHMTRSPRAKALRRRKGTGEKKLRGRKSGERTEAKELRRRKRGEGSEEKELKRRK